jgi:hypothetical protein
MLTAFIALALAISHLGVAFAAWIAANRTRFVPLAEDVESIRRDLAQPLNAAKLMSDLGKFAGDLEAFIAESDQSRALPPPAR